jgi:SAM-dependent methyltransferase
LTSEPTFDYKCKTPSVDYTCNICGKPNRAARELLDREKASCSGCGSNVRMRGLLRALSMELFGVNLALPDFPHIPSLRGLGIGDSRQYARRLAEKFDYQNTAYDRQPRFDIMDPPAAALGTYDFVVASEIFEHVRPPVDKALASASRLLKPGGVLVVTVPYAPAQNTVEHFPSLGECGLAQVGDRLVLVNRTVSGQWEVYEDLVFHCGPSGPALEMREFSEADLRAGLSEAGFGEVRIYSDDDAQFGVIHSESWSLPLAARKESFAFNRDATRDLVEQWAALRKQCREWAGAFWVRLGGKLGFIDLKPLLPPEQND